MTAITSMAFGKMLVEAGVMTEERMNRTERIVIDCRAGDAVVIYIKEFGQKDELAKLAPMLKGMIPDGG